MGPLGVGVLALALGAVMPACALALLVPVLARASPPAANYRGRPVFVGLGCVWLFWGVGVLLAWLAARLSVTDVPAWLDALAASTPLVLGACVLGVADDVWGARDCAKGFSGHMRALLGGSLTCGMVKLLGIGLLSVISALWLSGMPAAEARYAWGVCVRALVMALSANALNLLDLRPLRASKAYILALGALVAGLAVWQGMSWGACGMASTCALLLAPVLATWRFDACELGMLGACLGFLAAATLPLGVLACACVVLLALNLASERVSFSGVIARVRLLSWVDGLGRPRN